MTDRPDTIRIGCGAGFWGDTPEGPKQLIERGALDYLILDYLAEITMSILARMKAKDPAAGYATDFVTHVAGPLAQQIAASSVKIVTNAGGLNPAACRDALEAAFSKAGVTRKIALVLGDDLSDRADSLRAADLREMDSGAPLPDRLASINAYLGALPIAEALADGADIVITGRVTDSALALGPLIHEFGWRATDHDLLAAGSLAGHVLECGTQATGGIVTDWQDVPGWSDMGFPIAICAPDGSFELTKPEGTGGRITPLTVAEQITYEIGDPAAYVLPDVTCDFSQVTVTQAGPDRVRVSGAKGRAPTDSYKVCATYADGYRATATMTISGFQAGARAQATGEAILSRVARLAAQAGFPPFDETLVEVLGTGAAFGHDPRASAATEVVLRLSARHADKGALALFGREIYPAATAMAQGITGFAGGRPAPQPVIRLFSTFIDKAAVDIEVDMGGTRRPVAVPAGQPATPHAPAAAPTDPAPTGPTETLPLIALACARSGDKGDIANIGLLARDPAFLPVLRREVTADRVKAHFAHVARGPVTRHDWPGLHGFNFVMERALGGGGIASLRNDPQGKGYAQALLMMPVAVPAALVRAHPTLAAHAAKTKEPA
ncbi:acyclic terpene utilization AtuA family protein [Roseovarius sp.]|uniref:acyclic terpene utilization AtuA family protein n=1 Tax=Roseovarius sp. TaxID=1486281 RepID=UPI003BACDE42